jgi:hypothetical protein
VAALCVVLALAATVGDATAQWWPWGNKQDDPPVPREPMRRGQPLPGQGSGQYPGQTPGQVPGQLPSGQPNSGTTLPPSYGSSSASNICLQLEQRLVAEVQGTGQGRELLPKIESDMRELDRNLRQSSLRLERSDCWDTFLFSKTLRNDYRCRQLSDEVESLRQRLADLDRQRKQIMGTGDRSLQDDIIRELARNGCGQQYVQEARKRDAARNPFAALFGGGGEDSEESRGPANNFGNLPFATYRTLCVRLCDGYYFPVSFSTLPNHFQRDADLCHSQCAAPAELFYHQNPGGAVEQMISFGSQLSYTSLKTAFRYRKEFVQGCSCKQAEYDPSIEKKAEAVQPQTTPTTPVGGVRIGSKK